VHNQERRQRRQHQWEDSIGKDEHGILGPGWRCKKCNVFEGQRTKPEHNRRYRHETDEGCVYLTCDEIVVLDVMEA
jgi:hypothetical protein